eukprot:m.243645 g.243645  ORF g.243645 m.243645 type:complete len:344 (-) comp33816_c0_seq1:210-1241(-)
MASLNSGAFRACSLFTYTCVAVTAAAVYTYLCLQRRREKVEKSVPACARACMKIQDRGAIVIMCAVEEEAVHVRRFLDNCSSTSSKPFDIMAASPSSVATTREFVPGTKLQVTKGEYKGVCVELVVTNIGQANAAAATAAVMLARKLCDLPPPLAIISCGCAGAHRVAINKGDVVIATMIKPVAQIKILADGSVVPKGFRSTCQSPMVASLSADPTLLMAARKSVQQQVDVTNVKKSSHSTLFGAVASSDIWVCETGRLKEIQNSFDTLCEEMEAAAVAQVCADYDVPFLAIKDISNNELQRSESSSPDIGVSLDLNSIGEAAANMTMATITTYVAMRSSENE